MATAHRQTERLKPFRADPVKRYLLSMTLMIGIPALLLSWLVGTVVIQRLNAHILTIAGAEVESFVEALLVTAKGTEAATAPAASDRSWWQDFGERQLRNPHTVAVRVYGADGVILYANNPGLVGMRPARTPGLDRALRGERAVQLNGSLFTPIERRFTVMVPVRLGALATPAAIEVVQDFRPLRDELVLVRWLLVGTVLVVSLTFLAALLPLTRLLARTSFFDSLTLLPNRRHLDAAAKVVLARSRQLGTGAALFVIDLDRFKIINESLGHQAGDAVLREVAGRLQAQVRDGDHIAREGGDEFALLLANVEEGSAHAAATRIWATLERPIAMAERSVRVDASIGIALFPRDGRDMVTLRQNAERAMYRAKAAKVPFEFHRPGMSLSGREGLFLESELRDAIEKDGLELTFQPIVDLATDEVVAVETLTLWNHPQQGLLPALRFVPLAEDTGLVRRMDRWVLEQAAAQLAAWSALGRTVKVGVNLSAQTVSDPSLLSDLEAVLRGTGAPPDHLILEVTERTALQDLESLAGVLDGVRALGIHIALDDFGTGYSSLATLERLPISYLKIDQSFIHGIGRTPKDEYLIRAIAGFSRGMGIPIVAEGIETHEQRQWLVDEGVQLGQGYLLALPGPASAVALGQVAQVV